MSSRVVCDLMEQSGTKRNQGNGVTSLHGEHGKPVILGVHRTRNASHYINRDSTCGVAAQNKAFALASQNMHTGLHA